ncbi:hypothetical protein F5Y13DRAFT_198447 [Hypoxylon sp. FL1857]|nr:hypothetical protein F5Y13DRAFT_198447 [Hypoxylon sp. FL1857]
MLPEFLSGSYKQYKDDTSVFVTWLGRVAEACGYRAKVSSPSAETPALSQRLKGKARKEAKQALLASGTISLDSITTVKHAVSTRELVTQVNTIFSSKAKVHMPKSIKFHLKRAIDARQRCTKWYENAENKAGVHDEGGHRFFIRVLKEALVKLGGPEESDGEAPKPAVKKSLPKNKKILQIENRFSHLNVEDLDDSYHLTPTETALATSNTSPNIPKSVDVFELEEKRTFEDAFVVFCLFEDLHRIQRKHKEIWEDCNSGKTNLIAATAVTQAAICMIRQAEEELCSTLFPGEPADNCYNTLASIVALVESITKGIDPTNHFGVDVTPFDSFIFLPVARTLMKFVLISQLSLKFISDWPPPILPLRFNYIQDQNKADMPEHKKLQQDDKILSQLLIDLQLPDKARAHAHNEADILLLEPIARDIFLRTLQPVWLEGKLSVTAVFAAQMLLDILDVCSDLPKFSRQLTCANAHVSKPLDFGFEAGAKLEFGGELCWPTSGDEIVFTIYKITQSIQMPVLPSIKSQMLRIHQTPEFSGRENTLPKLEGNMERSLEQLNPALCAIYKQMNLGLIQPAPADDFAITHNPLYSGSAMLKLLLTYQEAGLTLANHHLSIFIAAHLYNALRQLRMLDQEWPLMVHIIQQHKRALFADELLTTTKDIENRLAYRLNMLGKQKRFHEDGKYKFREPALTPMLHSLLNTELSSGQVLWQIEQQMELLSDNQRSNATTRNSRGIQRQKQRVKPEEFIERTRDVVSGALDNVGWNVTLEEEGMGFQFESWKREEKSSDYGLLIVCHEAFKEARDARLSGKFTYRPGEGDIKGLKGRDKNPDNPYRHGTGMLVASKVFKEFIADESEAFKFPLASSAKDEEATEQTTRIPWCHRPSSAAELHELLSSTTYVAIAFYTYFDKSDLGILTMFADQAYTYTIPGIFAFAKVNVDNIPGVSKQYCNDDRTQRTFVFFKNGKQVTVNYQAAIIGSDMAGLKAATDKLGELAKKRAQQAGEQAG